MALREKSVFESAVVNWPMAKLLWENPSMPCGLNILDLIRIERLPGSFRRSCRVKEGLELRLSDVKMEVYSGSYQLEHVGELWELYRVGRREFVVHLCDTRFHGGLKIEEVLLMRAMVEQGAIEGNLRFMSLDAKSKDGPADIILRQDRSSQNLAHFLGDLASLCATLPADEATRTFLASFRADEDLTRWIDDHEVAFGMYRKPGEVYEFLKGRGSKNETTLAEFKRRLGEQYVPEFEVRLYDEFAAAMDRLSIDDLEQCDAALRDLGVSNEVMEALGNPSNALRNLMDTLKNSQLSWLPSLK